MSESKMPTEAKPHGEWGKVLKEIKRRCKDLNIRYVQQGNGHIRIVTDLDDMSIPSTPTNLKRHTARVVKWLHIQREFLADSLETKANDDRDMYQDSDRRFRHCEGTH